MSTTSKPSCATPPDVQAICLATYPRIYRVGKGWRIFCLILALFPIGFGAVGSWYFATENDTQTLRETAGFTGLCLVFVLFGIYMAASTIRSKLSLEENVISISGVFVHAASASRISPGDV